MALRDFVRKLNIGRRRNEPKRDTVNFPTLQQLGRGNRVLYKPTPRNLRYFSRTPMARRAINAIKSPIAMLEWEIAPLPGIDLNPELERQIKVATTCFASPNTDDSFRTLIEQVTEDYLVGAGAIEKQIGGDPLRPLWMWPVDGLSIQLYPAWSGDRNEARYAQVAGYGTAFGGGTLAELRNDELIYIRPNPSTATPFGFGPLEIAFNTISRLLSVGEFAGNVAGNARSSIAIDLGDGSDSKTLEAFRRYWENEIEGQGKVPITGMGTSKDKTRGLTVQRLFPEGDEALYLKYQDLLARELGCAFDLSPQNFGIERDVNRNTSEVAEDRDYDMAIKPCASLIAAHLTREALHDGLGFSQLMLHFPGLDREDEQAAADIFETYYQNNAIVPNEQRRFMRLPPLDTQFGDMTKADADIAIAAAKGAAEVLDEKLQPGNSKSKAKRDARKAKRKD
jgi:hypothetical protein